MKFILVFLLSLLISGIITYFFIQSKIDWNWAVFFNKNEVFVWAASPFVLFGMFVPLFIIGYFYKKWMQTDHKHFYIQFYRSLYSFALAYLVMTILKVFTNRVDMEPFEPIGEVDTSDQFRFGFMNSNSWWESFSEGWPSGHTMIALAMAIAIHPFLKSKLWRYLNIVYPIVVALSVATAFHWISDVIAGALIGVVIGWFFLHYIPKGLR